MTTKLIVIGAGLAGSEAAWQAAERGIEVELTEMRPKVTTPAHHTEGFAELVCSNSLRSNALENASGLLKEEMRRANSLILKCADESRVPAGIALAVDRELFSKKVTDSIENHPKITVRREEVSSLDDSQTTIIATGPLTSPALSAEIARLTQGKYLYFYDAISPILNADSIDMTTAFLGSRYGKGIEDGGQGDYINIGLSEEEYSEFHSDLLEGDKVPLREFEKAIFFEGCLPLEEMAQRGKETLAFGPLKPVGIEHPDTGETYHAVIQLRREDLTGEYYSMVGFQTRLKYPEQKRIFQKLPALQKVGFLRYGSLHRNTYLNSPRLIRNTLQIKRYSNIFVAGQLTGVEGYLESAATGLLAGVYAASTLNGEPIVEAPATTSLGALTKHITSANPKNFQPTNINFGLYPPFEKRVPKSERKKRIADRALKDMTPWCESVKP
ncbi:MAG: methylenetetrahydrofolate--tRNA-(uracil(54)-C(5))-methyltransferase (FADH(2)-oxidizing) TrmFO [Nitrospinaceae bacterium]|nr:methylenetetrahydrofolate--tRNA-(uracil(54)-C(5))-methyltransferase (FADH(2)-oxidizing) TrmFO [Nitrospinaceae bacterium]MBT3821046.1 methylenetetrahydrofolate--tRNA-(uracil(54)-C(5))-methyltransferase (FADH(2)-oxidizing) TrmFO [Nitrospinaceae bacterium]MBT4429968.1 methylenetetrahydrofolate--tRNA-(uracil(54)-C(5))-methyltransferase (FADH(2)-oxidizing) TrmFO [Nitrospinaceae bacterium]MBT5367422.1 methylenetetrahydrofolate--tRNA-(uracil(54)-C(5))-methyltransferase (FADH(2)-oxidizing) TrmFO [Nit